MSLKSVTKKHLLAPDQKLTKKGLLKTILIEMEFLTQKERNWYTITSNDTFEMFHKPINKSLLTLTQNPRTFEMSTYLSMFCYTCDVNMLDPETCAFREYFEYDE